MGKACGCQVLHLGGNVLLVARTLSKLEDAKLEIIAATGCDPSLVSVEACDCLDTKAVEAFFSTKEQNSLNHLVVTLGPAVEGVDKIFGEATIEMVQKQFGKFNAPWAVAKYGAPKLADAGTLTFFSGTLSKAIMRGSSCLASVNAAIECLAKCLALELGPRLRVNTISPTLTRTSAVTGGMSPEAIAGMFAGFGKSIPGGRAGEVADIGHAVGFLLTNNFMTGHTLEVDGGKAL